MHGSTAEPVIRVAGADEVDILLAIQRTASVDGFAKVFPPDRYPYPSDDVRELWRGALVEPSVDVYVAELRGDAVGTVAVDDEWLRSLYVAPGHQGTGVGSALHDHALARMRERGAKQAKLWTLEGNKRGRRFYEKRGWKLTGETRVVPFPPNPLDVCYSLDLTSID